MQAPSCWNSSGWPEYGAGYTLVNTSPRGLLPRRSRIPQKTDDFIRVLIDGAGNELGKAISQEILAVPVPVEELGVSTTTAEPLFERELDDGGIRHAEIEFDLDCLRDLLDKLVDVLVLLGAEASPL